MKSSVGNRFIFLLLLFFLGEGTAVFSQNCTQDRLILVDFFNAAGGENWTNSTGWDSITPLEDWYGVTMVNGCVTRLDLADNNLTGFISPEIGNLGNLKRLLLENNQLMGSIPSQLGQLTSLEFLILNDNKLTGSIPSQLGNLINLDDLYLFNNYLTGSIPAEIGKLPNLMRLFLNDNNLSGCFPDTLMVSDPNGLATYGNPKLPWEGDDLMYREGKEQLGARCNDSLSTTIIDVIQEDCSCGEMVSDCPTTIQSINEIPAFFCVASDTLSQVADTSRNNEGCVTNIIHPNWVRLETPIILNQTLPFDPITPTAITLYELAECSDCMVEILSSDIADCVLNGNILNCPAIENTCDSLLISFEVCKANCSQACTAATITLFKPAPCEDNPVDCPTIIQSINEIPTFFCVASDTLSQVADTSRNNEGCVTNIIHPNWVRMEAPFIPAQSSTFDPTTPTDIELTDCLDCEVTTISYNDIVLTTMDINGNMLNLPTLVNTCDSLKISFDACKIDCSEACTTATITLYNQDACEISHIFTPNGDNIEDYFIIPEIYNNEELYPNYQLSIFNNWGVQVYYTDRYESGGWDGRSTGNGQYLPDGAYFYLLRLNTTDEKPVKGVVSLIR